MPSIEDICVQETLPTNKMDFFAADVDDLAAAIKHKLQLKAKLREHSASCKHRRMSPYSTRVRTVCRHNTGDKENSEHSTHSCKYCILKTKSPITDSSDDPYEMLQELLSQGKLINEAVKRLQTYSQNKRPKKSTDFYKYDFDIPACEYTDSLELESI